MGLKIMIKVYICASFPRREEAQALALRLTPLIEIVSTWHRDDTEAVPRTKRTKIIIQRVMRDFKQVRRSQLVIVFIGDQLTGGGRHTELGLALGMNKDVILVGEYDSNPFELIPHLRIYKTADELVEELCKCHENLKADYKWQIEQGKLNRLANES